ncbi:hypothetical protein ACOCJ4_05580 [Knoellia sp. CPCC 206435]|uniref:hypothetical protein n=1 Tax=Knoellia terrae TaxID=3404797 RepID=UPI003B429189
MADPEQAHDNRVWTRAQDVLPGVVVHEETAMTAAWGDQVWTVLPRWDEDDVEGLWLENLDQPSGPPTLHEVYPRAELLRRIGQSHPTAGEAIVTSVLDDFADCLTVTAQAHRRLRHWAAALLDDLERLAPSVVRDLDELASGRDLRALARRPAPSQQDWH